MIVSTYQPFFAPFPAFFHKVHLSDLMVILDDVQFPLRSTWITRNRFKNDQGALWVRVPVWKKGVGLQRIRQVRICNERNWPAKSVASLSAAYAKAPYFRDHRRLVEDIFSGKYERLMDLNMAVIRYVQAQLGVETPLVLQSDLGVSAKGADLLIDVCRETKASEYLAQVSARKHIDLNRFALAGIKTIFCKPPSPVYPQLWGDFIPDLSALDLLFNCGPKSREILLGN